MNATFLSPKSEKNEGPPALESPGGKLEMMYIEEYLKGKGFSRKTLSMLTPERKKRLMSAACLYASMKLAEVENRAHLVRELHGQK